MKYTILHDPPFPRVAWTGGSSPTQADIADPTFRRIRSAYFQEQLADWNSGWGDLPNLDTCRIFWGRATYDAWATVRAARRIA